LENKQMEPVMRMTPPNHPYPPQAAHHPVKSIVAISMVTAKVTRVTVTVRRRIPRETIQMTTPSQPLAFPQSEDKMTSVILTAMMRVLEMRRARMKAITNRSNKSKDDSTDDESSGLPSGTQFTKKMTKATSKPPTILLVDQDEPQPSNSTQAEPQPSQSPIKPRCLHKKKMPGHPQIRTQS